MSEQEPVSEGGFRYSDRSQVLCRTCMAPIWWETGEVDHRERTGWSDRIKRGGDSLVCFKAIDYRHVPLTDREWAYYEAGERTGEAAVVAARHLLQKVADYWDGRPLRMHGEHIYADLIDVLDAMSPATTEPQQEQQGANG